MSSARGWGTERESGFTVIELMVAMLVMMIAMFSLTVVLVNSLADTAYARQRATATNLANQAMEEVRSLNWNAIEGGMSPTDIVTSGDRNIVADCVQGQPLDVQGLVGTCLGTSSWTDPTCLSQQGLGSPPDAGHLAAPLAPLDPHQACYQVGSYVYGVDVYITGVPGTTYVAGNVTPLTATVFVTWGRPIRNGLSDHVVTTSLLSGCLKGGAQCASPSATTLP